MRIIERTACMIRMRSSSARFKEHSSSGIATHLIPAPRTCHTCHQAIMRSVHQTGSVGTGAPTNSGCGLSCDWTPGKRGACTTFASFSQNSKLWVSTPKASAMVPQGSHPPSCSIRVTGFLQPHHRGCLRQCWSHPTGHTAVRKTCPLCCRSCVKRLLCNILCSLLVCPSHSGLSQWVRA